MTACSVVMERTRALLMTSQRDVVNSLSSAVSVSATSVSMTSDTSGITVGSWIDIDAESMIVTGVSALDVSVIRAQRGSTANPHAAGSVVRVNPRFHGADIFEAINNTLAHLCSPTCGLFRPEIVTSSIVGLHSIPLSPSSELLEVRSVTYKAATDRYAFLDGWIVQRHPYSATFPAGVELKLSKPAYAAPIEIVCATEFIPMDDTADDIEGTSGLAASAVPLLQVGAALWLAAGREIARNFFETQGDTRRAGEVPSGSQNAAMQGLRIQFAQKVTAEAQRLAVQWPRLAR